VKDMLLLFDERTASDLTPEEGDAWLAFRDGARKEATEIARQALEPATTATVVNVRDGKRLTTDGPFADIKEQLGGFFVFDCDNFNTALDIAARVPIALTGHVEVRAVHEVD
jgi:hypothetical protein